MESFRCVAFCPHCGNRAPQKLVYSHRCSDIAHCDGEDGEEEFALPVAYYVAICETCDQLLLYYEAGDTPTDNKFYTAGLSWPLHGGLHSSVPPSVAEIYAEASRIKQLAPNAFAGQIRRALEALCEDRGAKSGPLHQRLKDLAAHGEIPTLLAEMTDVLRLLGNVGVHATDQSVQASQVFAIDEFFRSVIEYVYVAPSKLSDFRKRLEKLASKSKRA